MALPPGLHIIPEFGVTVTVGGVLTVTVAVVEESVEGPLEQVTKNL